MSVLQAMARQEGFGVPAARPTVNNNPLDLEFGPEASEFGATGTDGRFAIFPDVATGWNAGRRWLSVPARFDTSGNLVGGYMGATLEQVINRFAPPAENETNVYLANVCEWSSLKPTAILTPELLG
jgi:hypothetical protein